MALGAQTTCKSPQTKVAIDLWLKPFKTLGSGSTVFEVAARSESYRTAPDSAQPSP